MIDPGVEDRLHRMLEGRLEPAEAAALRETMARDPKLREHAAELETAFEALAGQPLEEPPAELREHVMRAIRAEAGPVAAPAASRRPARFALPLFAAAAALVVVGVLVTSRGGHTPLPPDVQGTMGAPAPPAIDRGDLGRYALVREGGGALALDVTAGTKPLTVIVRWRPGDVRGAVVASGAAAHNLPDGMSVALPAGGRERLWLDAGAPGALALDLFVQDGRRERRAGTVAISPDSSTH